MDVRDRFFEGMSHAASTVNIVTTGGHRGRGGVTVSAMCSVSADPPSLLLCVHHQSNNAMSYDGKALVTRPIKEPVSPGRIVMARLAGRPVSEAAALFRTHCAAFFCGL